MPRYIVNDQADLVHDKATLRETCNVDDIAPTNRREVGVAELQLLLNEGFGMCQHCFGEIKT